MINNLFSLNKKNILITGATGFLGKPIALTLAQAGANVLVNSRSKSDCDKLVNLINKKNLRSQPASFDITNKNAISKFASSISKMPIHGIINNAYNGKGGTIETSDSESYFSSYDLSVVSAHNLTLELLNNLRMAVKKSGDASIINIASMYGLISPDPRIYISFKNTNPPFYGVSKAALIHWTKYAACEFGHEKIRFNAISPGAFPSTYIKKKSPQFINKLNKKIPLGRVGRPNEITGIVLMLASKASTYLTGENIVVDGGWTSW